MASPSSPNLPTGGFTRLPRQTLVDFLAASLGQEKASDAVTQAATDLGMPIYGEYNREQTLNILERLTRMEGLVAVVARFAKARLILLFKSEGPKSQPPV